MMLDLKTYTGLLHKMFSSKSKSFYVQSDESVNVLYLQIILLQERRSLYRVRL